MQDIKKKKKRKSERYVAMNGPIFSLERSKGTTHRNLGVLLPFLLRSAQILGSHRVTIHDPRDASRVHGVELPVRAG